VIDNPPDSLASGDQVRLQGKPPVTREANGAALVERRAAESAHG
jgi:hypothetical protein